MAEKKSRDSIPPPQNAKKYEETRTALTAVLEQCSKFGYRLSDDVLERAIKALG